MQLTLTLKTAPTGAVHKIELDGNGTVADIIRRAEVVHGLRIKTVIFRGSVLGNVVLVEAGVTNGSTLVVLLHKAVAAPVQMRESEPAPRSVCALSEEPATTVPLCAWMGQLPTSVREGRSICELTLPCAHNAGARSMLCVPQHALAKFVGPAMAGMPFVEQIARPIASAAAICQSLTVPELLAAGVRGLDIRVGMHEGELHVCHTVVCELTLAAALGEVMAFLVGDDAKGEIVVIFIKCDWEARAEWQGAENWEHVQAVVLSVLGDSVCTEEELALPLARLLELGRRAVVLMQVPSAVEMCCGIRSIGANMLSNWSDSIKTAEDVVEAADSWRASGQIKSEKGRLKMLECAVPGNPMSSAPEVLARFRRFLGELEEPLRIAVNMDCPDEATIRSIVQQNWR